MGNIIDVIDDYSPADESTGVPLLAQIKILFDQKLSTTGLEETFFVEGPDTDQFVGPGFQLLEYPDNVSDGDDFLTSPGYKGMVDGTFTFEKVDLNDPSVTVTGEDHRTRLIFTPTRPMAALTEYTAHLPEIVDDNGELVHSGYITFSWTTGTGSIQALPSTSSTSILVPDSILVSSEPAGELSVIKTTPANHAVQIKVDLDQIVIEFDKGVDPASVVDVSKISVVALPATDHPKASVQADGELAKSVEVQDNKIIIKI